MSRFVNRLISREEVARMSLEQRVELEARVTDALGENVRVPTLQSDWTIRNYTDRNPWRKRMFDFLGPLEGKTILDLGCGYNPTPVYLALAGAKEVIAVDVSPKSMEFVRHLSHTTGLENRITPLLAPAARLPLDDQSIDLVHGEAVLHHLRIDEVGPELARVLKPGGRAAFKDPLGHNWLLDFTRDYLPYRWKHSIKGTDRPMKFTDIQQFGTYFSRCEAQGFGLLSMFATGLLGRRRTRFHSLLHRVDHRLLHSMNRLQYFCRFIVTCVEK